MLNQSGRSTEVEDISKDVVLESSVECIERESCMPFKLSPYIPRLRLLMSSRNLVYLRLHFQSPCVHCRVGVRTSEPRGVRMRQQLSALRLTLNQARKRA